MASSYNGVHTVGLIGTYSPSTDQLSETLERINHVYKNKYTPGSGAYQINAVYTNQITTASTSHPLASSTDKYGNSISFASIKTLAVINKQSATGEDIVIGGSWMTTNFGGSFTLGPGGIFVMESPIDGHAAVGSIDISSASSYTHQIFIMGVD